MKIRILKESKTLREATDESYGDLYNFLGVTNGHLDTFLSAFVRPTAIYRRMLKDEIMEIYGDEINSMTEDQVPPGINYKGYRDPLTKVKSSLMRGFTYWFWKMSRYPKDNPVIKDPDAWREVIEMKVDNYFATLEFQLEELGYPTMTEEEFNTINNSKDPNTRKKLNPIYEKHFWEDYLDSFFQKHMSQGATGNLAFAGARSQETGLYGYMKDIFMTSNKEALEFFKQAMKTSSAELYKEMRPDQSTPVQAKDLEKMGKEKPEFFFTDTPEDEKLPGTGYSTAKDVIAAYAKKTGMTPEEVQALINAGQISLDTENEEDKEL